MTIESIRAGALLLVVVACSRPHSAADSTGATSAMSASPNATSGRAAQAAAVSNAIAANPGAADSILKANGYSREEFQRVMYEIARDSAQSAAYAAAKKG